MDGRLLERAEACLTEAGLSESMLPLIARRIVNRRS